MVEDRAFCEQVRCAHPGENGAVVIARRRRGTRLAALLASAALLVTALGVFATPASAYSLEWNCGVLSPGTWCLLDVRHTYTWNDAEYRGTGSTWVCQKTIDAYGGGTVQSSCATNYTGQDIGYCCLQKPLVYNGGPNSHTIWGWAAY